jgi:hypothetical protein
MTKMNSDNKDFLIPIRRCQDCKYSIMQDPDYVSLPQLVCQNERVLDYTESEESVAYCNQVNRKGTCPLFKRKGLLRRLFQ